MEAGSAQCHIWLEGGAAVEAVWLQACLEELLHQWKLLEPLSSLPPPQALGQVLAFVPESPAPKISMASGYILESHCCSWQPLTCPQESGVSSGRDFDSGGDGHSRGRPMPYEGPRITKRYCQALQCHQAPHQAVEFWSTGCPRRSPLLATFVSDSCPPYSLPQQSHTRGLRWAMVKCQPDQCGD